MQDGENLIGRGQGSLFDADPYLSPRHAEFILNDEGLVGPIGGIRQKLAGARAGGSSYFLAPAANCDEVVGHIPDGLEVFKISTFDEAKTAVEGIAKGKTSGLPHC